MSTWLKLLAPAYALQSRVVASDLEGFLMHCWRQMSDSCALFMVSLISSQKMTDGERETHRAETNLQLILQNSHDWLSKTRWIF